MRAQTGADRHPGHATDLVAQQLKVLKRKPPSLEVEALVGTGATRLYLKPNVIRNLGLTKTGTVS